MATIELRGTVGDRANQREPSSPFSSAVTAAKRIERRGRAPVRRYSPAMSSRAPTLIGVAWGDSTLYPCSWAAWCDAAGVAWLGPDTVVRDYDEEHYALHAASAGQGLVLASSIVIAGSLACGLLAPVRPEITVPGETYHVLTVPGRERHPPVRAFLRWLDAEMRMP